MKIQYFFLFLVSLIFCDPKIKPKFTRKEIDSKIYECMAQSENISETVKTFINENKDEDIRGLMHKMRMKLNKDDRKIYIGCRKKLIGEIRKPHKEEL